MRQIIFARRYSDLSRRLAMLAQLALALLLLTQAAQLTFQPDPRDDLRRADGLLADGHYYDALQTYTRLSAQHGEWGDASLQVGMLREIRGEHGPAMRALYTALGQGLRSEQRDLA